MRILYSHYLPFEDQPAGHMIRAVARELRRLGHEVEVHASAAGAGAGRPAPQRKRLATVRAAVWFARAIARDVGRRRRDEEAVARFRPDVLLVRQDPYCGSMIRAGRRRGVPVVTYADAPAAVEARFRNDHRRWHPPGLVEAIERRGLAHSAAIITVSRPAAALLQRYHLPVPVHVIPNGFDPTLFPRFSEAERRAERERLGLRGPLVVGFQGTFQAFHGIDRLRDLMLAVRRPDVQWLLIGDGPELPALRSAVAGKADAVFLGRRPPAEVGRLLALADVAVAPYPYPPGGFYGCPLKVLEYAAAGCAVLASDLGDVAFLLDKGQAGILLPPDDTDAWSRELVRLLDDRQAREALGGRAREWVFGRFTWGHTAAAVAGVLEACRPSEAAASGGGNAGRLLPARRV